MKSKKSLAAQIHHIGHIHWITSIQQEEEENIKMLDSCNKNRITSHSQLKSSLVKFMEVGKRPSKYLYQKLNNSKMVLIVECMHLPI